jgi:anti-sigma factor RsiW
MKTQDQTEDDRIDALVRQAAARPVDEARLSAQVLSRIRQSDRPEPGFLARIFALPDFAGPGRLAPVGFALVLVATPFAVAFSPADQTERALYAFALGDPALIAASEGSFFGAGLFE